MNAGYGRISEERRRILDVFMLFLEISLGRKTQKTTNGPERREKIDAFKGF